MQHNAKLDVADKRPNQKGQTKLCIALAVFRIARNANPDEIEPQRANMTPMLKCGYSFSLLNNFDVGTSECGSSNNGSVSKTTPNSAEKMLVI
jgi:hypothetical protein